MNTPSRPSFDEVMDQARRQFVATGQGIVTAFEELSSQLTSRPEEAELLATLKRELHRLHGSAATFGFARVGRMAAALESAVKRWQVEPALDRARRGSIVAGFTRTLRDSLVLEGAAPQVEGQRLMLVQLTDAVAVGITTEASARGYRVERLGQDELEEAIEEDGRPLAIVAAAGTPGIEELDGVARLLLRKRDRVSRSMTPVGSGPLPSLRVLESGTEPVEILDALETIIDRQRQAVGTLVAVDDDPVIRQLVRVSAEHAGFNAIGTADVAAFRAALASNQPSLLVIDVDIGGDSGIDLVAALRNEASIGDLPILMLSGHSDAETRGAAFSAGCDDYMLKPFAPGEFQRRIAGLLEATRRRRTGEGIHPAAAVPLPARTIRDLEAELAGRGADTLSIGVVQPVPEPTEQKDVAAWHREVRRLAIAVAEKGGLIGFTDDFALGFVVAGRATETVAVFTALAGDAPADAPPWRAGVADTRAKAGAPLTVLLATAREAFHAALDSNVPAREWDPADSDIAPDVVVVEDDATLADLIAFALGTRGFSHRTFHDGPTALEGLRRFRVRGHRPIILLDIDLPGLDGHSLHERLRVEMPGMYEVVFLSAHGAETEQLRALKAGALDFVVKPVSLRVLIEKLAAWRARASEK